VETLSASAFRRASEFVHASARLVDRALFAYEFEGGSVEAVWDALGAFANPDGGFGHAMEPDCRLPLSSCLATTTAMPYLIQTGAPADHPLVRGAIRYLVESYDDCLGGWWIVPPEANEYPRAIWWQYDEEPSRRRVTEGWANPSASAVACLLAYPDLVPPQFLDEVTRAAVTVGEDAKMLADGHCFLCYTEFAEHAPAAAAAWERLRAVATQAVATRPEEWSGYGIRPLWAVPTPASPLMDVLGEAVQAHLDYEIGQQQPDGSWHPFWAWGQYEDEWQAARVEWQGVLTVKNLRALQAHGRLAAC
jgi:hypothetical protein